MALGPPPTRADVELRARLLGFTAVSFGAGALSWWAPIYLNIGFELNPSPGIMCDSASIALVFGVVTCLSGVLGVACGALLAKRLRTVLSIGRIADRGSRLSACSS